MQTTQWQLGAALLVMAALAGCGDTATVPPGGSETPPAAEIHAHPSEGPHDGELIELGNEEFHAEIVHGKEGEVTVYVLDSSASKAVPIAAADVTINVTHDGKAEQFKLPAAPDEGDPAGQSSRFSIKDPDLAADLDEKGVTARLVLTINGTQYTGKIEHQHGHEHGGHKH